MMIHLANKKPKPILPHLSLPVQVKQKGSPIAPAPLLIDDHQTM